VVWRDFTDQLSPAQEELMKYFGDLDSKSGFPIFYLRRRTTNGFEITAIGLSRYFRLVAPAQPRDVADAITDGVAMPERIFGRAGQTSGSSLAGRVFFHAATPCQPHNPPIEFPSNGNLVAGNPSATAVSLYLEQVAGSVHLRCGIVHQNEGLTTFASPDPVLRGRKLYWHRQQPVAPPPPNANPKVQARYFPLPAQTVFEFSLTFERLDAIELGALVEALELPVGAAHKLGLGKPFGLGSVRVDLDLNRSRVQADRARYGSIRSRFGQQGDCSKILGECRMAFRNAVVARRGDRNFEDLTHVREFRVMTNFVKPRDPKAIGYMALKADNQTVSYRMKPILPKPLEIPPATRCV
jgi:CRISPR-associated protein (TIGR03986 family)